MQFTEASYWQAVIILLTPLVLWASWIDYKERRVPNYLNALIGLAGITFQCVWFGWSGLSAALLGGLLGLGLLIVPWLAHMMGAGDVKLLAAAGMWLGPHYVLWGFVVGALIGGLASVVMITLAKRWPTATENLQLAAFKCLSPKMIFTEVGSVKSLGKTAQLIPYGVPLTAGILIVLALKLSNLC